MLLSKFSIRLTVVLIVSFSVIGFSQDNHQPNALEIRKAHDLALALKNSQNQASLASNQASRIAAAVKDLDQRKAQLLKMNAAVNDQIKGLQKRQSDIQAESSAWDDQVIRTHGGDPSKQKVDWATSRIVDK